MLGNESVRSSRSRGGDGVDVGPHVIFLAIVLYGLSGRDLVTLGCFAGDFPEWGPLML